MTILALDLGKIKSVGCIYQTGTREHTYQTVRTSPQTLHDLIVGFGPQRVVFEIVKRSDVGKFVVLPKRWIVERTFAWLGKYCRLSKDYESDPRSSEAMIRLAMINRMLHRLQPG